MSTVHNNITGNVTSGRIVQCGDEESGDVHNSITGSVTSGTVIQCGNIGGVDLSAFRRDSGPTGDQPRGDAD
ncbi:hypothetical protein NQK81_01190 [Amycolatopsis roodepoortensis]|uniref:hypothetical protein n=1 Tax=Amycolatopsis roodepoortensis TaxID=700274 RepID=UPI00214B980F|nr:hypothetical protein [Amycolatopsis roodepoortensis]UUV32089.1 hypothetical protein NQK81_01190 [Amycolatopsis roodepoortensis]